MAKSANCTAITTSRSPTPPPASCCWKIVRHWHASPEPPGHGLPSAARRRPAPGFGLRPACRLRPRHHKDWKTPNPQQEIAMGEIVLAAKVTHVPSLMLSEADGSPLK